MQRAWKTAVKILTGLSFTAMAAMPQAYTISARPGAVNYIEGTVTLNGGPVSTQQLRGVFLNASDTLATESGKAEVLLTPGVFLRLGDKSEVRMVSPSLTDTQVELLRGDAMIEADDLNKDNRITMLNHGASIILLKSGLYRFSANDAPLASVIFGKAQISYGDKKVEIGKGNQALLNEQLTRQKFDAKKEDELFAWSNVRSEYNAASSYQTANNVSGMGFNSYGGSFGGFGPYGNNLVGPGWYWNSGFNSYSWLPGGGGAFFSPFGYGFYGAGLVGYAPVVRVPVGIGGRGPVRVVPVNGNRPPNFMHRDPQWGQRGRFDRSTMSPAAYQAARARAGRAFAQGGGFRNGAGGSAPSFTGRGLGGG
ncbi:MAG TPA: hypothetical protein VK604_23400, partial [Bryobacteraceae bacterium]|nr:hypothetical protein [Bryobacteraceae bacterium]